MIAIAILPALTLASVALAAPAPVQLDARVFTDAGGLPGGFVERQYECYKNAPLNGDGLLFKGDTFSSGGLVQADCAQFCYDKGWTAFGIQNGEIWYCGASSDLDRAPGQTSCRREGGSIQKCGGPDALTVFTTTLVKPKPVEPAPVLAKSYPARVVPNFPAWQFKAQCNRDSRDNRLLSLAFYDSAGMTWQKCVDACQKKGKNLAGIEYGGECYCGDAGEFNAKGPARSDQCNMPCPGDSNQLCGGPDALSIIYRGGEGARP